MTDLEMAWAAGLFEGEGTVRINKPSVRNWGALIVSVVNTDRQIVDWFQARWPGYMKAATGLRPEQRDAWVWVIAAGVAVDFLRAIRPFVVRDAVRAKIDHGLEFQAQKSKRVRFMSDLERYNYAQEQWNAHWWMCHLNERGRRPNADEHRRKR